MPPYAVLNRSDQAHLPSGPDPDLPTACNTRCGSGTPFAAILRATDRQRLVQPMALVWDNILPLPAQTRRLAEPGQPKFVDLALVSAAVRITVG